ncbi:hypothetical protein H9L13_05835 [Sphingomonas lutea]|uniref:Uncharacterized protein n=1 Tax=Sphingomonas lutea TaxID=1045317 RepID=A0A7G9SKK6_9SPHN|nr:hypothetical protein [Sphingomonas lutea]QNN68381.1 hypothetical protein H9L13_05835 [Sphingomonas lutea]
MMDEIFDRSYQSGRTELNAGIDRGLKRIARRIDATFRSLHRVQWSAPWDSANKAHLG